MGDNWDGDWGDEDLAAAYEGHDVPEDEAEGWFVYQRKKAKPGENDCDLFCLYCDMPLPKRHEHDHFPVPKRHDGKDTFCTCMNCHELKDRTRFMDLTVEMLGDMMALWQQMTPQQRIVMAKMYSLVLDAQKLLDKKKR